jgi:hypothetical protein
VPKTSHKKLKTRTDGFANNTKKKKKKRYSKWIPLEVEIWR